MWRPQAYVADENPPDQYLTLARPGEATLKEKGSQFLAFAYPIRCVEQSDSLLSDLWKQYHDATHIGWARRLAPPPDGAERWSDNGEPNGSTGPPILNAIKGEDLWGVFVAVVRYYGGTKLGVGGLVRAYGGAAAEALANTQKQTITRTKTVSVEISHERAGAIYALADRLELRVDTPGYTEAGLTIPLIVPLSRIEEVEAAVIEVSAGRAQVNY
jgi:uncharacterized YigZ family protein